MVWPLVAIGAVQAGYSMYQGMSGSRKAKAAGKATSDMILMESAIAQRRAKRDLSDLMKQANRAAYASGIQVDGSTSAYLDKLKYRGYEGIEDIRRIGAAQARAARKGGQVTGSGLMAQGIAGALGSAAGALGSYYTYQQNTRLPTTSAPAAPTGLTLTG